MKEYGAENEHICCYQWYTGEYHEMPGDVMNPAPEIGKNVFKILGVPKNIKSLLFDDGVKYTVGDERLNTEYTSTTETIGLGGFDKTDIEIFKFETCSETSNFNGCIYVLDRSRDINNGWDERARLGSWFPLGEYKKYEQYFGSYPDWYSEERSFGDLDDDDKVTSSDALITLRLSAGIGFYNDFTLSIADDDKDGTLTSADALVLLQMSVEA